MKTRLSLALAASCVLAQPASAATYVLDLTGTVASGTAAQVIAGNRFDFFTIALSGFSPLNLVVGDEIQATITLDQSLTVPTANVFNGMDFGLLNSLSQTGISTETEGATDLFDGGSLVISTTSSTLTSDQVVNDYLNFAGTTFSFDKVFSSFTVTSLGASSLDVDHAYLRYVTANSVTPAVPEPASWALMLLGFGLTGAALRRRPKVRLTYA